MSDELDQICASCHKPADWWICDQCTWEAESEREWQAVNGA